MWNKTRKVFCIGRNKTGTTSVASALKILGYKVGKQAPAELLLEDWAKRDFTRLVKYCRTADAFQDIPFSLDYTYQAVDTAFPGGKFILTVRNSPLEWYESLTRFHTNLIGKNRLPNVDDLKNFPYRKQGWIWRAQQLVYGADEHSLYDQDRYIAHYESYNTRVQDYFAHRENDLLVINVSEDDSMQTLSTFLGNSNSAELKMPHLNSSR